MGGASAGCLGCCHTARMVALFCDVERGVRSAIRPPGSMDHSSSSSDSVGAAHSVEHSVQFTQGRSTSGIAPTSIYDGVLVRWTRLCHSHGLLGEGLLVMLSLVWIFWPCYVPLKSGQWTFFYSAGPWSLLNMQRARSIVARAWRLGDIY